MTLRTDGRKLRPRLVPGIQIEATPNSSTFNCRHPVSGKSYVLRKLDAQVAHWSDGKRTLEDLTRLAQQAGSTATADMIADLVRRMIASGILEPASAPEPAPAAQLLEFDDDGASTVVGGLPPELAAPPPVAPLRASGPKRSVSVPQMAAASAPHPSVPSIPSVAAFPPPVPPQAPAQNTVQPQLQDFDDEGSSDGTEVMSLEQAGLNGPATPADKMAHQLEALASLSMEKGASGASTQYAAAAPSATGGSSTLPWVLLGAVLLAGGGYFGWTKFAGKDSGGSEVPVLPQVRVDTVRDSAATGQTLLAAGYLSAPKIISMGSTLGGRIQRLYVENGSKVKKNQVVIQFDDGQVRAELKLNAAKLASARRALSRARKLFAAEATTAVEVDSAVSAVQIASAEYEVKKQELDQCKIRAPITGTVIEVPVHEGEVIKGDSTAGALIKLADLTELVAEVDVNEADIPLIRVGQAAEVTTDAAAGKVFTGKVKELSQQADRARGTVLVKVSIANLTETLRPGMSVKVAFREDENAPARLLIPRSAVVEGQVFVVQAGVAKARPITYLSVGPNMIEVSSGLEKGERIVVEGAANLRDGAKVE